MPRTACHCSGCFAWTAGRASDRHDKAPKALDVDLNEDMARARRWRRDAESHIACLLRPDQAALVPRFWSGYCGPTLSGAVRFYTDGIHDDLETCSCLLWNTVCYRAKSREKIMGFVKAQRIYVGYTDVYIKATLSITL